MKYRRFVQDFERLPNEQLLRATVTSFDLCKRYNILSGQLYAWKRLSRQGKAGPEPPRDAELTARVQELEHPLCKVTLPNEFLKESVKKSLKQAEKENEEGAF